MNRHCKYWTFNDKQLQSVVSKFCGHYCICYCLYCSSGIDMRKIVCSFTSDTALTDVLVHALVCRIRKWKRIINVQTSLLLHTHTHTLLMSLLFDQFDDAPAQVQMTDFVHVRLPFTSLYIDSKLGNGWHSGHSNAPIWFWWPSCRWHGMADAREGWLSSIESPHSGIQSSSLNTFNRSLAIANSDLSTLWTSRSS